MAAKRAYLALENGRVFEGRRFGADAVAEGELVFTTGMTGYLETLTDPSYSGQIVMQTFPLIGNYGVIPGDFEGARPRLAGYVVRQWCDAPSNFRSEGDLDAYLRAQGIPALCGVDTRALTRILRTAGVMRALLSDSPDATFAPARPMQPVLDVTTDRIIEEKPEGAQYRVVLWDFGAKRAISRALLARRCEVITVPATMTAGEILALRPDGVLLSNGPGDPAVNGGIIVEVGRLAASKVPMMGICLGHQLLALSQGAQTHKLPFGHRGANQPARDTRTGRIHITSQNHGYAVSLDALPGGMQASFINVNDGSCEGLTYRGFPAFSVQFHPEACAGPLDTGYLFDEFLTMLQGGARHAAEV